MKYKMGEIQGKLANARKIWIGRSINPQSLMEDFNSIASGDPPTNINTNFNHYQKNRYREWSEAYKDIQALRDMGYSEFDILSMIKGRRAFTDKEVDLLMLGRYVAANVPTIDWYKNNGFNAQIKELNRKLETYYLPNQFYDELELTHIKNAWDYIPLGQDPSIVEDEIKVPFVIRGEEIVKEADEWRGTIEEQRPEFDKETEEMQKGYEKSLMDQQSKAPAPIGTPGLDSEIFTASRVSPTFSGSQVNQQTGLTGTQEALLNDPLDKLIAKKQNQGIASLA